MASVHLNPGRDGRPLDQSCFCGDSRNLADNDTIARIAFSWTTIQGLGLPSTTAPRGSSNDSFLAESCRLDISAKQRQIGLNEVCRIARLDDSNEGVALGPLNVDGGSSRLGLPSTAIVASAATRFLAALAHPNGPS
ncbi:hypothetical protein CWO90_25360 [Bradyrhizobium sp. Leo121]|nr:hypothetical protein CWO90_25360 [Bradyrhizobium sp. Leo121]